MREQAAVASQAAKDRIQVAKDGKKLLDEGAELAAEAVVAKKASQTAADMDQGVATRVHIAIVKLEASVKKLRYTSSVQETQTQRHFSELAEEHERRVAIFRQIAGMLEKPASSAAMSPEECDALAIVQAKAGCVKALSKTSDSFGIVRQRTLASVSSMYTSVSTRNVEASDNAQHAPTLLEGLQERACLGLHNAKEMANNRVETARAGKKLLDDGGEDTAVVVVAKKASVDAAEIDRIVADSVKSAILMFDESSAKLKAVSQAQGDGNVSSYSDLAQIGEEHEIRAHVYRQISNLLESSIGSSDLHPAEWDALSFVKIRDGCDALQCRTNEGFEIVKSMVFSPCDSQLDQEGRSKRTVCA